MSLGVPVMACPHKKEITEAIEDHEVRMSHGAFGEAPEPVYAIIDNVWSLRPDGIIHIGAMTLQESLLPPTLAVELMQTVTVSSLMAKTLDIPFVYVTPGGIGDIPSTPKGAQGMLLEDLVRSDQLIVQVNGLFGPNIENQVKRWVYSEKLTIDDTRKVNPVSEEVLKAYLYEYATRGPISGMERSVITVGGSQTTWYEFFVNAGLVKTLPWTDPFSKYKHREYRWEWAQETKFPHDMGRALSDWYSTVHKPT